MGQRQADSIYRRLLIAERRKDRKAGDATLGSPIEASAKHETQLTLHRHVHHHMHYHTAGAEDEQSASGSTRILLPLLANRQSGLSRPHVVQPASVGICRSASEFS